MKMLIPLMMIIPILSTGCENRKFEFVGTINVDNTYEVDQTGFFDKLYEVSRGELLNLVDIPEDAEVTEVNVEKMLIKVIVLDDNKATTVTLSGAFDPGTGKIKLFDDYPATLVAVDAPYMGLNDVIAEGVGRLKQKIEAVLKGKDDTGFSVWVYGDSWPTSGNRIHVNIIFRISGSVKYTQCESVLFFIEGGDPC